jgi:acyl-CoA thioesterase-1
MSRLLLIVILSLSAPAAFAKTILVLGDSISAAYGMAMEDGWVNLLRQRLDAERPGHYTVINASVSGDTTALGLRRLPPLLERHDPDKVIVELGGNDGLRGLPLQQMRDNLGAIIELCRANGAEVVLVSVELPRSYGAGFNRRYLAVFDSLEKTYGLPRISLGFDLLDDRDLMQADGIHPTEAAQPLLLEAVWPVIAPRG